MLKQPAQVSISIHIERNIFQTDILEMGGKIYCRKSVDYTALKMQITRDIHNYGELNKYYLS